MKMKLNRLFILIFLLFISNSLAQKSNYEIIDSLIHLSVKNISNLELSKEYELEFNGAENYKPLKSNLIEFLQMKGLTLVENNISNSNLVYNLDEVKIIYSEVFKDGIFGNYLVNRIAHISGSYYTKSSDVIEPSISFIYNLSDSVNYSEISNLENIAYTFTKADLPEEHFFSSTLEPIIAIGTAAVAIYLFFNIRSK